jgi:hypothetical protein
MHNVLGQNDVMRYDNFDCIQHTTASTHVAAGINVRPPLASDTHSVSVRVACGVLTASKVNFNASLNHSHWQVNTHWQTAANDATHSVRSRNA